MKSFSKVTAYLLSLGLAFTFLGFAAAGVAYLVLAPQLPAVDALRDVELQVPLKVYTADGKLLAEFGQKKRTPVTYEQVPQALIDAFIAAEDQRFYEHPGVDYQGLLRAIWYLVRTGEKGPGGSTITMQVARNFFLTRAQTYLRKANEILLALKIERELSKRQILELYMNKIYLGHRAYGVGAAARVYFGKSVDQLSLPEIAMIAGLPKAPSSLNPITNPKRARVRRGYVLGRMLDQGFITKQRYDDAMQAPMVTAGSEEPKPEVSAPYVAEMVRQQMIDRFGEENAYTHGYRVYTTLEADRQRAAVRALRLALHEYDERHGYRGPVDHLDVSAKTKTDELRLHLRDYDSVGNLSNAIVTAVAQKSATVIIAGQQKPVQLDWDALSWAKRFVDRYTVGASPDKAEDVLSVGDVIRLRQTDDGYRLAEMPEVSGALVSLAPDDGSILALVGGYDFYQSSFNRVTQARRQPGSAFKPFIYSAALENGFTPATLVNDAPVVFRDKALESTWRPENYSGQFFGPTRLRKALYHSRNLVSIRVLRSVGIDTAIKYVSRFGFDPEQLPRNLSLALGSASVTPLELARGYAAFANGGFLVVPHYIERIEDGEDHVVFQADPVHACDPCEEAKAAPAAAPAGSAQNDGQDVRSAPRIITPQNDYLIDTMLQDVITKGTGRGARVLDRSDLAGKTGTTNQQRDAWFSGFNHGVVATAWVGFDQVQPLGHAETGARAALPMWIHYMRHALKGVPQLPLKQPPGLVTVRIDSESGLLTSADNPNAIFETFREGKLPKADSYLSSGEEARTPESAEKSLF